MQARFLYAEACRTLSCKWTVRGGASWLLLLHRRMEWSTQCQSATTAQHPQ
ncbi:hypothetical protein DPMN_184264 [Dreissena polymorpha]|uniref:Uncharacterized protein n=1 Tax=Dreissena polymorpha TaxID=45954 RepID=A0A9D4I772_DREPO|nr:hypothetical protein DPMN_184264 [Dreissena polymorpha]